MTSTTVFWLLALQLLRPSLPATAETQLRTNTPNSSQLTDRWPINPSSGWARSFVVFKGSLDGVRGTEDSLNGKEGPGPSPGVRRLMQVQPVDQDTSDQCPSTDGSGTGNCLGFLIQERTSSVEQNYKFASCGGYHTCLLKNEDSQISCLGRNSYGQIDVPAGLENNWNFISCGWMHTCGIRDGDQVYCWGDNRFGQAPRRPEGPFSTIASGMRHSCGLRTDGTIECWGEERFNKTRVPPGTSFISVCVALQHTCAVDQANAIRCWGLEDSRIQVPRNLLGRKWIHISCGGGTTCATDENGWVECWGQNVKGVATVPKRTTPIPLTGGVQASDIHDLTNSTTGTQILCNQNNCTQYTPHQWLQLEVGMHHVCGVFRRFPDEMNCNQTNSPVQNAICWGDGAYDQTSNPYRPCGKIGKELCEWRRTSLCETIQFRQISAGGYHSCGITFADETGKNMVKCWGLTDDGQVGITGGKKRVITLGTGSRGCQSHWTLLMFGLAVAMGLGFRV